MLAAVILVWRYCFLSEIGDFLEVFIPAFCG